MRLVVAALAKNSRGQVIFFNFVEQESGKVGENTKREEKTFRQNEEQVDEETGLYSGQR